MSGYSPNFTARYRVRYTCNGTRFTNQFRFQGVAAQPAPEFVTAVAAFYNALTVFRYTDWVVEGAEAAASGSDIFLPATAPVVNVGDASVVGRTRGNIPVNLSFVARSGINNQARLFVYGVSINPLASNVTTNQDYRLYSNESTGIAGAVAALVNLANAGWCAADGNQALYVNPYANIALSAYRQRKLRNSA